MEKKSRKLFLLLSILVMLLTSTSSSLAFSQDAGDEANQRAQQLLDQMTPEEKVGQLFLVTFQGQALDEQSDLYALMQEYQIGGVILSRGDDNFLGPDDILQNTYNLNYQLQKTGWDNRLIGYSQEEPEVGGRNYIPMFVGIAQDGDSYPFAQILSGLSNLSNQMSIGATFSNEMAQRSGELLAAELNALGFNLLLGPSLDVLDASYAQLEMNLSTRTFGGDPYWVGELGKAFIQGLHDGSNDQMVVIAKHFPGRGSSDRLPEEEVATVRKSLEQLKLIELAPFFTVADSTPGLSSGVADGFLVSHIRYQGFQGNIRETTKPVSFDASALSSIMGLPEFNTWRQTGGILISDSLGGNAVRNFFDPDQEGFDAKQVALNAFLAGNDMLFLDDFQASGDDSEMETIEDTLRLFTQKYREDKAFAERVDESVLRILRLKYRIFDVFTPNYVFPDASELTIIGQDTDTLDLVALNAATLINPSIEELSSVLPGPPIASERIVFITDSVSASQCVDCPAQEIFSETALQDTVERLYGSEGTGQILQRRLRSYSFQDLTEYLDDPRDRADVASFISEANWLVFSILDLDESRPYSDALKRILEENPELLRDKKVIVFAFNDPFYLDATDIASVDAYYCLFSKTDAFIDTAARLLFQEIVPRGHSPISIPEVGYDLIEMTYPDPTQIIGLEIDEEALPDVKQAEIIVDGIENLVFRVGDALPIKTAPILDRNGLTVPDGTIVYFMVEHIAESEQSTIIETATEQGIAKISYPIQSYGRIEIRTQSDPAKNSEIFVLDISSEEGGIVSEITPTPSPTLVGINSVGNQGIPDNEGQPSEIVEKKSILATIQWLLASIVIFGISYLIYVSTQRFFSLVGGASIALLSFIGGYLGVLWFFLDLPGSFARTSTSELFFFLLWIFVIIILGAGIGVILQVRKLSAGNLESKEDTE